MLSSRTTAFAISLFLVGSAIVLPAAELRNQFGDKKISRVARVSYQISEEAPAPPAAATQGDTATPMPSPETLHQIPSDSSNSLPLGTHEMLPSQSPIGSGVREGTIIYEDGAHGGQPFVEGGVVEGQMIHEGGCGCASCSGGQIGNCGPTCGGGCCGFGGRWWVDAEYLFWWRQGTGLPPLVTTAPSGVDPILSDPRTSVLFGNETVGDSARAGVRFSVGHWFDPCQSCGVEARFLSLGDAKSTFATDSSRYPVLGLAHVNAATGQNDALIIALDAGTQTQVGSVNASASNDFSSFDIALRKQLGGYCGRRVDFVIGYQASRIDDDVRISGTSTVTGGTPLATGTRFDVTDQFSTTNEFHGAILGFASQLNHGPCTLRLRSLLSVGNMSQTVSISGITNTSVPGGNNTSVREGLLAQSTNAGSYSKDQFTVIPELSAQMVWQLGCHIDLSVGYSILYFPDVALAGDQIDSVVNLNNPATFTPATARPTFRFNSDDYFIHGLTAGVSLTF